MQVRNALKSDIEKLAELERECFHAPIEKPQLERMLAAGDEIMLCAGEPGSPAGYVSMQTVLDEGYINNVAVFPEYRRMGIGRALLNELDRQGRSRELSFMTLEVRESNGPAIALYTLCGFEQVGLRKNYYEKPKENAIIMTKFLK